MFNLLHNILHPDDVEDEEDDETTADTSDTSSDEVASEAPSEGVQGTEAATSTEGTLRNESTGTTEDTQTQSSFTTSTTVEECLKNLITSIKSETLVEYNNKFFSAMNMWITIGNSHPDKKQQIMYLTMAKSVALLINHEFLTPEQAAICNVVAGYVPPDE